MTNPIAGSDTPLHLRRSARRGLRNLGHTCYQNSTLQVLFHHPTFREYVMNSATRARTPLHTALRSTFALLSAHDMEDDEHESCAKALSVDPSCVAEALHDEAWRDAHSPRDATSFMSALLQQLVEEMPDEPLAAYVSREHLLGVYAVHKCPSCKTIQVHALSASSIVLEPRHGDLLSALARVDPDQILGVHTGSKCDSCKACTSLYSETHVSHLPPTLTLRVNRTRADGTKDDSHFSFPRDFPAHTFGGHGAGAAHYRLQAVIVHEGPNVEGHYYTLTYNCHGDEWLLLSDHDVFTIPSSSLPHLLERSYGGPGQHAAYCLVYDLHSTESAIGSRASQPLCTMSAASIEALCYHRSSAAPTVNRSVLQAQRNLLINIMTMVTVPDDSSAADTMTINRNNKPRVERAPWPVGSTYVLDVTDPEHRKRKPGGDKRAITVVPQVLQWSGATQHHWEAAPSKHRQRITRALAGCAPHPGRALRLKVLYILHAGVCVSRGQLHCDDPRYPEAFGVVEEVCELVRRAEMRSDVHMPGARPSSKRPAELSSSSKSSAGVQCPVTLGNTRLLLDQLLPSTLQDVGSHVALGVFGIQIVQAYFSIGCFEAGAEFGKHTCEEYAQRAYNALLHNLSVKRKTLEASLLHSASVPAGIASLHPCLVHCEYATHTPLGA